MLKTVLFAALVVLAAGCAFQAVEERVMQGVCDEGCAGLIHDEEAYQECIVICEKSLDRLAK